MQSANVSIYRLMNNSLGKLILLTFYLLIQSSGYAIQPVSETEARIVAERWLATILQHSGSWGGVSTPAIAEVAPLYAQKGRGRLIAYLAKIEPAGYILVSSIRELPPVKAHETNSSYRSGPAGSAVFEDWLEENLLTVMEQLEAAEAVRGTMIDASANQQSWNVFLESGSREVLTNGIASVDFAVRDPLLQNAVYQGGYPRPLAWDQIYPYNRQCPQINTIPEEIWLDRDDSGTYTETLDQQDLLVVDADGGWVTIKDQAGIQEGLYFYDQDGSLDYTCTFVPLTKRVISGEKIWKDGKGGRTGKYDLGIDIRIYPAAGLPDSSPMWATLDGVDGLQTQLYYTDADNSGDYTFLTGFTRPGSFVTGLAELMRYWEWPDAGVGSHTYNWAYFEGGLKPEVTIPLTANFDHPFPWSKMPLNNLGIYSESIQKNVAQLIYDVGVALEVDFERLLPSQALTQTMMGRFANFFKYNNRAITYLARANETTDYGWFIKMQAELDAKRPFVMRVFSVDKTFIGLLVDGYDKIAGSVNLYQLHVNVGSFQHWYTLDNVGGLPFGSSTGAKNDVLKQDAVVNIMPQRVKPVIFAEVFLQTDETYGLKLTAALQDARNTYGNQILAVAYHPSAADTVYCPEDETPAKTAMTQRVTQYGALSSPPQVVLNGDNTSKISGSNNQITDRNTLYSIIENRMNEPARFRLVGDCVLGKTPDEGRPIVKGDIYVSRLDEELPETTTVTVRVWLIESVDASIRWVFRDMLAEKTVVLGCGENRIVSFADFPTLPASSWNLDNCEVVVSLEAGNGNVVQAGLLERYFPGPNYKYDEETAMNRPRLINRAPIPPTEVILTQSAGGTQISCMPVGASDPDGDAITYVADWYLNGNQVPALTSLEVNSPYNAASPTLSYNLASGQIWTCEIRVRDCYWSSAPGNFKDNHESATILSNRLIVSAATPVNNQPPTIPGFAELVPSNPAANEIVTCLTADSTDPDDDVFSYRFQWYRKQEADPNFVAVPGLISASLPYGTVQAEEIWYCAVSARDAWGAESPAINTTQVTIITQQQNPPTAPISVATGPQEPSYLSTLKCSEPTGVTCPDASEIKYRWWKRVGESWFPTDQTTTTVALALADVGSLWRCEVHGRNTVTGAVGPSLFTNELLVRNFAPSSPSVSVSPAIASITDELKCDASSSVDREDGDMDDPAVKDLRYHYEWLVNGEPSGISGFGVKTVPSAQLLSGQVWTCRVYVQDQYGARSPMVDSVNNVSVGGPPGPPTSVNIEPTRPEDEDNLKCTAEGAVDPDGDMVIYEYHWYWEVEGSGSKLDWLPPNESGRFWQFHHIGQITSADLTADNGRWCCLVYATDGIKKGGAMSSVAVRICNQAPSAPSVVIDPKKPKIGEAMTCTVTGTSTDIEGDPFFHTFKWYRKGDPPLMPFHIGPILPEGTTKIGEEWWCDVTVTDICAHPRSSTTKSRVVVFQALAPSIPSQIYITPTYPKAGEDIECHASGAVDSNDDPIHYVYAWYLVVDQNDILQPGLIEAKVTGALVADGQKWRCQVKAVNSSGLESEAVFSASVNVANVVPYAPTKVAVTPDPAGVVADLICAASGGVDPNNDPVEYIFQWYQNGAVVEGATNYRVSKSLLHLGDVWKCEVRCRDNGVPPLESDATFSNEVIIRNLAPAMPVSVVIVPEEPTEIDHLICVASGGMDPEGDTVTYEYAWYRNGDLTSHFGRDVPASAIAIGEIWYCESRAVDLMGVKGPYKRSPEVTIRSAAPTSPTVLLSPGLPRPGRALRCNVTGSQDPLGGQLQTVFQWYRLAAGGSGGWLPVPTQTGPEIPVGVLQDGEMWKCAVFTRNTYLFTSPVVVSQEVFVMNHAPGAPISAVVTPDPAGKSTDLQCTASGATDPNEELVNYEYRWYQNGLLAAGQNQNRVGKDNLTRGDIWFCEVRATDGELVSNWVKTNSVVIRGTPPSQPTSIAIEPDRPEDNDDMVGHAAGSIDPDAGETVQYQFQWYKQIYVPGVENPEYPVILPEPNPRPYHSWELKAATDVVPNSLTAEGEYWVCAVTATDGLYFSAPLVSKVILIGNQPPDKPVLTVSPVNPRIGEALTCTVTGALDPDGDLVSFTFTWVGQRGTEQLRITMQTLPAGFTLSDDVWYCEVTATDNWRNPKSSFSASDRIYFQPMPPSIPNQVYIEPVYPRSGQSLECHAEGSVDPNGDPVHYIYAWFLNGTLQTTLTGAAVPGAQVLDGQVWTCTVKAADNGGLESSPVTSLPVTVGNKAPGVPTAVQVSPDPAGMGEDLVCIVSGGTDPNGDPVSYTFQWYRNGAAVTGLTDYYLPKSELHMGEVWKCEVRSRDNALPPLDSAGVFSNEVMIQNLAPTAPVTVEIVPELPTEIDILLCVASGGTDPEGDSVSYRYAWYRNGEQTAYINQTITPEQTTAGETWVCEVRSVDNAGLVSPVKRSMEVTIAAAVPVIGNVRVTPAEASVNDNLTCTVDDAVDPLQGTLTFFFKWYRYRGGTWQETELNTEIVPASELRNGDLWKCTVYCTNSQGFRSRFATSNEVMVQNHAPQTPEMVFIKPDVPAIGGMDMVCYVRGITDRDENILQVTYAWYKEIPIPAGGVPTIASSALPGNPDGFYWSLSSTAVDSPTNPIIPANWSNKDRWVCVVSVSDGILSSPEVASNVVTVTGHAPSRPNSVALSRSNSNLVCTASGSADPDGDSLVYLFNWYRNGLEAGISNSGSNSNDTWSSTLTGPQIDLGDEWYCIVTVRDSSGASSLSSRSNAVLMNNQAPRIPQGVAFVPANPTVNNSLYCSVQPITPIDDDGDIAAYLFAWYKNGILQPGITGPEVPSTAMVQLDKWLCKVTARDEFGLEGAARWTQEITVLPVGGDLFETDDNYTYARPLIPNAAQQNHAIASTDVDWLTFSLDKTQSIRIIPAILNGSGTLELSLYIDNGLNPPLTQSAGEINRVLGPGNYYLRIQAGGIGTTVYSLKLITAEVQSLGTNLELSYRLTAVDSIGWAYAILTQPENVTITAQTMSGSGTLTLTLYDAGFLTAYTETTPDTIQKSLSAGIYYLKIQANNVPTSGDLTCRVILTTQSGAPVLVNVPPTAPITVKIVPEKPQPYKAITGIAYGSHKSQSSLISPISYYFFWYQNDTLRADLTGRQVIDGAYIAVGDTWRCEVLARDAYNMGSDRAVSLPVTVELPEDWELALTITGAATAQMIIGQKNLATNGWDDGIDDLVPPLGQPGASPVVWMEGPVGESYTDLNGNRQYDIGEPFIDNDGNGVFDVGSEPYNDANSNGQYEWGEAFTDSNGNNIWDEARLTRDFRAFRSSLQVWYIRASKKSGVQITWDSKTVPSGAVLVMSELDEYGNTIPGTDVDMLTSDSFDVSHAFRQAPRFRIILVSGGVTVESLVLHQGWNLISFTLRGSDDTVESIFAGLNTSSVWKYIAETGQYNMTISVQPKIGYWLYSPTVQTIQHLGMPELFGNVSLIRGWNLVGPVATCTIPTGSAIMRSSVYGYNSTLQQYEKVDLLQVNRGYWIFTLEAGETSLK